MAISWYVDIALLRAKVKTCEASGHHQQVAYSTHHDALTQVCWTCRAVRTSSRELYAEADRVVGGG